MNVAKPEGVTVNAIVKPKYLSVFEFLEWENQQETRHELIDGEIVAMTGGTVAHAGLIVSMSARFQCGAAALRRSRGRSGFTFGYSAVRMTT